MIEHLGSSKIVTLTPFNLQINEACARQTVCHVDSHRTLKMYRLYVRVFVIRLGTELIGYPFTLLTIALVNCPSNSETGVTCSCRGSCVAASTSATRSCDNGYKGSACQTAPVRTDIIGSNTEGYAAGLTTQDQSVQDGEGSSFTQLATAVRQAQAEEAAANATPTSESKSDSAGDVPQEVMIGGVVGTLALFC